MNLEDKKKQIPWIVFRAKKFLDDYLKKDMKVFEWGSGGSTIYFCKKVNNVFAIEHDETWYNEVKEVISKENINNCEYYLIKPIKNQLLTAMPYNALLNNSKTFDRYKSYSFKKYVRKIDEYPDRYFDFIFVDGRARAGCIKHAINKVKKGGILMLDNSERIDYKSFMGHIKGYERKDFYGRGPYSNNNWQTTIWYIK